jgi:hypothetical protein
MTSLRLKPDFADDIGALAVQRLIEACRHEGGGTRPIADFLVSLHNARYATVDAYQLCRRVDDEHFYDVLAVLRWFRDAPFRCDLQTPCRRAAINVGPDGALQPDRASGVDRATRRIFDDRAVNPFRLESLAAVGSSSVAAGHADATVDGRAAGGRLGQNVGE